VSPFSLPEWHLSEVILPLVDTCGRRSGQMNREGK
jgi:hypothetical protein